MTNELFNRRPTLRQLVIAYRNSTAEQVLVDYGLFEVGSFFECRRRKWVVSYINLRPIDPIEYDKGILAGVVGVSGGLGLWEIAYLLELQE